MNVADTKPLRRPNNMFGKNGVIFKFYLSNEKSRLKRDAELLDAGDRVCRYSLLSYLIYHG